MPRGRSMQYFFAHRTTLGQQREMMALENSMQNSMQGTQRSSPKSTATQSDSNISFGIAAIAKRIKADAEMSSLRGSNIDRPSSWFVVVLRVCSDASRQGRGAGCPQTLRQGQGPGRP